ncbi:MAG TPA: trypsin-like peptidase domain-containing protein [Verrucomicrobiae bacterium]|nr:trypsin-like peptidase domain-containing protein [Verrucomicrobiae bacterium]
MDDELTPPQGLPEPITAGSAPDLLGPAGPPFSDPPAEAFADPGDAPGAPRRWLRFPAALALAALVGGGLVAGGEQILGSHGGSPSLSIASGARTPTVATSGIDASSVAAKVEPAVVDVSARVLEVGGTGTSAGTGMIVTSGGEVLTNNHVVAGATSITVTLPARHQSFPARVIAVDPTQDIALLQLEGAGGLPTVTFANPVSVHLGEPVVAIGNAYGIGGTPSVSSGTIVALDRAVTASDGVASSEHLVGMLQTNAQLARGDSGGPLVDASGDIVGMDTAAATSPNPASTSTTAFSIPSGRLTSVVSSIQRGSHSALLVRTRTAFLGIDVGTTQTAANFGFPGYGDGTPAPSVPGALVLAVIPGTPAAASGLQPGDVITAADGHPVRSPAQLKSVIKTRRPGQSLSLTWQAGATVSHGTVQLAPGPVA